VFDDVFINGRVQTDAEFSLENIKDKINAKYTAGNLHIIYSDQNSVSGYVIRIRLIFTGDKHIGENTEDEADYGNDDQELLRRMQQQLLNELHLFGVPGIKKVGVLYKVILTSLTSTHTYPSLPPSLLSPPHRAGLSLRKEERDEVVRCRGVQAGTGVAD
jgi:hypothetical protein